MSIVLVGSTSGSCTLQEQAVAGNTTLTLPTVSGTILTTGSSGQSIPKAALPTGSVLQVVQATSTTQTTSTNTWTDTSLSASITPTSSTSKILVIVGQNFSLSQAPSASAYGGLRMLRGSTVIMNPSQADSGGPYMLGISSGNGSSATNYGYVSFNFLDSPATTSSTTYKTQQRAYNSSTSMSTQVNDGVTNGTSTITLMEIAA